MASAKQQETMLLTEHFTYPPISLLDDIINTVNEVVYKCTDTFETGLLSADPALLGFDSRAAAENKTPALDDDGLPTYPEARLEIEEGILKLETLMEKAVDVNFDKLEIWTLRNVLCLERGGKAEKGVGEWVRLGHYENLSIPPKDNQITPESIQALRRKLAEAQKLRAALLAEKSRNETQIQRLRSLLQPSTQAPSKRDSTTSTRKEEDGENRDGTFAFLTHNPAAQNLGIRPLPSPTTTTSTTNPATLESTTTKTPLTTQTTFTTSQLPYLRSLLATLKPHIASAAAAPSSTSASAGETEELSKERRLYIESQSRRILERRGVDTRDGVEGMGVGGRIRADEVAALEGIAEALGGNASGRAGDGDRDEDDVDGDQMDIS